MIKKEPIKIFLNKHYKPEIYIIRTVCSKCKYFNMEDGFNTINCGKNYIINTQDNTFICFDFELKFSSITTMNFNGVIDNNK